MLTDLRELRLRGNCMRTVPAEIGALSFLRFLDLAENGLTSLPDTVRACLLRLLHLRV
jgi:Leucine-rich repeat (LRR) protein